jgi:hypothetical protein
VPCGEDQPTNPVTNVVLHVTVAEPLGGQLGASFFVVSAPWYVDHVVQPDRQLDLFPPLASVSGAVQQVEAFLHVGCGVVVAVALRVGCVEEGEVLIASRACQAAAELAPTPPIEKVRGGSQPTA